MQSPGSGHGGALFHNQRTQRASGRVGSGENGERMSLVSDTMHRLVRTASAEAWPRQDESGRAAGAAAIKVDFRSADACELQGKLCKAGRCHHNDWRTATIGPELKNAITILMSASWGRPEAARVGRDQAQLTRSSQKRGRKVRAPLSSHELASTAFARVIMFDKIGRLASAVTPEEIACAGASCR